MAALCAHMGASIAGKAVVAKSMKKPAVVGRSVAMPARASAAGVPGRATRLAGDCGVQNGVVRAKKAQRGKVIVEAVPDSFSGFPGQSKKPDGFMEAFFGPNPNKGKVYAPLQFRFLSLLPYMIPCMGAIAFTDQAFMAFPITWQIAVAISPVLQVFYSNSFIPFITFFTLFLAVVRNTKLNHFLRYNTMQAILLDICVMLAGLIMQYLPMFITVSFIGDLLETMTLMNALFALGYCAWNVVQGQYPEIPIITEAVYAQVRDQ